MIFLTKCHFYESIRKFVFCFSKPHSYQIEMNFSIASAKWKRIWIRFFVWATHWRQKIKITQHYWENEKRCFECLLPGREIHQCPNIFYKYRWFSDLIFVFWQKTVKKHSWCLVGSINNVINTFSILSTSYQADSNIICFYFLKCFLSSIKTKKAIFSIVWPSCFGKFFDVKLCWCTAW